MQLCQSLICLVLLLPLALVFGESLAYFVSASLLGLVVIAPVAGWLFEVFAAKSESIAQNRGDAPKSGHCAIGAVLGAPPNGGPAERLDNSEASGGPPSVS